MLSKDKYLASSSSEVVTNILEKDEEGMVQVSSPIIEDEESTVVHKLPQITKEENDYLEVVVKKGDNLEKIAKNYNSSLKEILRINDLKTTFLRVGQTLLVPKTSNILTEKEKIIDDLKYYTIKCGDNPWTIAMKHHLKVDELLRLNHLNEEKARKLRPGDKLRIR